MSDFDSFASLTKPGEEAPVVTKDQPSPGSNRDSLNLDDFEKVEADQVPSVTQSMQAVSGLMDDIVSQATNSSPAAPMASDSAPITSAQPSLSEPLVMDFSATDPFSKNSDDYLSSFAPTDKKAESWSQGEIDLLSSAPPPPADSPMAPNPPPVKAADILAAEADKFLMGDENIAKLSSDLDPFSFTSPAPVVEPAMEQFAAPASFAAPPKDTSPQALLTTDLSPEPLSTSPLPDSTQDLSPELSFEAKLPTPEPMKEPTLATFAPREPSPDPFAREPTPPPKAPTPTPAPREPTPPPREPTPPPREPTPPPKEPTPPPREPTPPPREPTPPPREPTPPPREPTPPPKVPTPTPVLREPTPPPREPTPPPREPTPPPKAPTPPPREPTPPPKAATPTPPKTVTPPPMAKPVQEAKVTPGRKYVVSEATQRNFAVFSPLVELIYWRDVKKSGGVFGGLMLVLISLAYLSLISVVAYTSLALLSGTITFRIYKNIMQAVQKSQDGHPFKDILEMDTSLPTDKVHEATDVIVSQINSTVAELKRLFLVEDLVDSVKFGCLLWCLTYLGSWFNGLTLIILGVVALFSLPKVYEQNQAQVDQYVGLVRSQVNDVMTKVKAALPIGNKEKAQ